MSILGTTIKGMVDCRKTDMMDSNDLNRLLLLINSSLFRVLASTNTPASHNNIIISLIDYQHAMVFRTLKLPSGFNSAFPPFSYRHRRWFPRQNVQSNNCAILFFLWLRPNRSFPWFISLLCGCLPIRTPSWWCSSAGQWRSRSQQSAVFLSSHRLYLQTQNRW